MPELAQLQEFADRDVEQMLRDPKVAQALLQRIPRRRSADGNSM